jgi:sugar O-acyltransferase (sialic acid O-acetyltransferase NeuD family)
MTDRRIFIYGASGHGKVVADALLASCTSVLGFIDDGAQLAGARVLGLPVLGDAAWLAREAKQGDVGSGRGFADVGSGRGFADVYVALGIGENRARQAVARRCRSWGARLLAVVHPRATIAASARVAEGAVVMAGAVINAEADIEEGAIVNTGAVVEHDSVVGEYAHVSPNATMGGTTRLGELSQLGLGASMLPTITVGSRSIIGAGAVVVRNIPDGVIAFGVPARITRRVDG